MQHLSIKHIENRRPGPALDQQADGRLGLAVLIVRHLITEPRDCLPDPFARIRGNARPIPYYERHGRDRDVGCFGYITHAWSTLSHRSAFHPRTTHLL